MQTANVALVCFRKYLVPYPTLLRLHSLPNDLIAHYHVSGFLRTYHFVHPIKDRTAKRNQAFFESAKVRHGLAYFRSWAVLQIPGYFTSSAL